MRHPITNGLKDMTMSGNTTATTGEVPLGDAISATDAVSGVLVVRVDNRSIASGASFKVVCRGVSLSPLNPSFPYPMTTDLADSGALTNVGGVAVQLTTPIPDHLQVFFVFAHGTNTGTSTIRIDVELELRTA